MTISCPKCASRDGRSVESIYCQCTSAQESTSLTTIRLSRKAAPPSPRHPLAWQVLAAVFAIAGLSALRSDVAASAAFTTCAILSGWMARDALRYNNADLPRLLDYWHHSLMCTRCGEMFIPA